MQKMNKTQVLPFKNKTKQVTSVAVFLLHGRHRKMIIILKGNWEKFTRLLVV